MHQIRLIRRCTFGSKLITDPGICEIYFGHLFAKSNSGDAQFYSIFILKWAINGLFFIYYRCFPINREARFTVMCVSIIIYVQVLLEKVINSNVFFQTRQPIFAQLLGATFRVSQCSWLSLDQRLNVENCIRTLSEVAKARDIPISADLDIQVRRLYLNGLLLEVQI